MTTPSNFEAPADSTPVTAPTKAQNLGSFFSSAKGRNTVLAFVGAIAISGVFIFAIFHNSGGSNPAIPKDATGTRQDGASVGPGDGKTPMSGALGTSPQYAALVKKTDDAKALAAKESGASAQPSFNSGVIGQAPAVDLNGTGLPAVRQDPVPVPRVAMAGPQFQPAPYPQAQPQSPVGGSSPQDADAQKDMVAYVGSLLNRRHGHLVVEFAASSAQPGQGAAGAGSGGSSAGGAGATPASSAGITLITAGTIEAMQTEIMADTSQPGPIFATLLSGPLAGAKLIGNVTRQDDRAKLLFTQMSVDFKNGTHASIPITAFALDPETTSLGVATDVDHKLFAKYMLRPLAGALEAVGQAARSAGTTVNVNGAAVSSTTPIPGGRQLGMISAGGAATQIAADVNGMNLDPVAKVAPKTVLGIAFATDVVFKAGEQSAWQPSPADAGQKPGQVAANPLAK